MINVILVKTMIKTDQAHARSIFHTTLVKRMVSLESVKLICSDVVSWTTNRMESDLIWGLF